jgi:RNA polymerase sigma-70 factor (ECF subfamily)
METADSLLTSLTLLKALCGPETDEAAWRIFYDRYQPLIAGWCARQRLQAADVEDVTQQVLQRVFTKIKTYDSARGRFRGWLKTVVDNAVKDLLRGCGRRAAGQGSGDTEVQKKLEQLAGPGDVEDLAQTLEDAIDQDLQLAPELAARVKARVRAPHNWQAFWLTAIEGQPAKEVAEKLGMSIAAVYVAKKRVGDMLNAEGARFKNQPPDRP